MQKRREKFIIWGSGPFRTLQTSTKIPPPGVPTSSLLRAFGGRSFSQALCQNCDLCRVIVPLSLAATSIKGTELGAKIDVRRVLAYDSLDTSHKKIRPQGGCIMMQPPWGPF